METIIRIEWFSMKIIILIKPFSIFVKRVANRKLSENCIGSGLKKTIIVYRLHGNIDCLKNTVCQISIVLSNNWCNLTSIR